MEVKVVVGQLEVVVKGIDIFFNGGRCIPDRRLLAIGQGWCHDQEQYTV